MYAGPRYDKEAWRASVTNGDIPKDKLAVVEFWPPQYDRDLNGPALAHPEAAAAMGVMLRQAVENGFGDLGIALSYRTYAKQVEKYANYQAFLAGGPWSALAAYPGTSNHGWAVAFDMNWGRAATLRWLQTNAARYGFTNDVPSEEWHWTYQEGRWNGDDMTDGEKRAINRWERFLAKLQTELGGEDTPESLAARVADAVTKRHDTHADVTGLTEAAADARYSKRGHTHDEGQTAPDG